VGIFSFLTGNKPAEGSETTPPSLDARFASSSGEAGSHGAVSEPAPYTPPEGFDTSSLTAPMPAAADPPKVGPADPANTAELQSKIIEQIKTVYDPEIPVDIYELGLIYEIIVDAERRVLINMTLTSPACPSAQQIPSEVRYKVKAVPGVTDAWVEIVWDPPWSKERMSEVAKLALGFF
jgi:FeS assembly SUF system protein